MKVFSKKGYFLQTLKRTAKDFSSSSKAPLRSPAFLNNYKSRAEHLEDIKKCPEFDVVIIGGGSVGCGALLSASQRQLSCCLLEGGDFGSATSSKSTKLLHGGLRYWQNIFDPFSGTNKIQDFKLILEGLQERDVVSKNAPYISNEIGMVFPCTNFL